MVFKQFGDVVLLPEKRDVLRVHLYFKLIQYKVKPFENDIDIILELYLFGGYHNAQEQAKFIELCLEKGYRKSKQSVRNTLSRYATIGVFNKPKNTVLYVDDKYIPNLEFDKLALFHKISHAN